MTIEPGESRDFMSDLYREKDFDPRDIRGLTMDIGVDLWMLDVLFWVVCVGLGWIVGWTLGTLV